MYQRKLFFGIIEFYDSLGQSWVSEASRNTCEERGVWCVIAQKSNWFLPKLYSLIHHTHIKRKLELAVDRRVRLACRQISFYMFPMKYLIWCSNSWIAPSFTYVSLFANNFMTSLFAFSSENSHFPIIKIVWHKNNFSIIFHWIPAYLDIFDVFLFFSAVI